MDRVGIYLRISEDRDGQQTATARQQQDCRGLAEARGWTVVDVFEDVDVSAYKRKAKRPEFERMIGAVRDGEIDIVLAWKLDRITRRLRDFARLDEECETAGARVVTLVDAIDTGTSAGRVVASIMTSLARAESENISVRTARKHRELAQQGRTLTGGSRAFGYARDRKSIVEPEAALIREAAARLLDGATVLSICHDYERRGVVSPSGKAWQVAPFKRMITSPLLSGQRCLSGTLTPGTWPAIIDPRTSLRLVSLLSNPDRRTSFTNARSYLLSGMLRCGRCAEPLVARPTAAKVRRYVCAKQPGMNSCGKLARLAEPVEEMVREAVCLVLDGVDLRAYTEDDPGDHDADALQAIREDEESLAQLSTDFYVDKLITRAQFFAANDAVQQRLKQNRSKLGKRNGRTMLQGLAGGGDAVRKRWPTESLEWRRALVASVIDHVVILPAVKGDNRFNPALVGVVWRF